ncbi:hypothetical protein GJAV_G00092940 [Gymnothorax javanicus]|nr:hypothetical protein GJAV_G00092940 [Gymnothorax javanicus]
METGDSSSFLRQDDRHANEEACEALLLGELSERGMGDRSKDEDPINSGLKMEVGLTVQPGAMTVPATGGTAAEGIPCKECGISFESLQEYMEHRCPNARRLLPQGGIGSEVSDQEDSDVETLDGEIVYQPNGSAFIIKESRESLQNSLPGAHGHFFTSDLLNHQTSVSPFPQVINTFHIASSVRKQLAAEPTSPNTSLLAGIGPVLHSFRVYDLRHKGDQNCRTDDSGSRNSCVSKDAHIGLDLSKFDGLVKDGKSKPVLMCFLCRMSFGYVRSFVNHAILDHKMVLNQEEQKAASTASLHASIPSVKGSMGFASPEDDSVTPNAETDLQTLSTSDTLLRQGCILSGAESKIPESQRPGNMEGSGPMDFSRMEYPIKREPLELAETEEDGGIYYCETEEDVNNCIGEQADFAAGEDLTLSNQSPSLMKSASLKPLVNSTLHFSAVTTQQALAPKDQSSDTDGQSGNETECMTVQNDASDSPLDEQRSSDRSPFPPHHQASGKPNTILDDASTGQGSAGNDMTYAKCDAAQGSSLSLSDHLGIPQSGIPCKTLKCPMCNWHYKYQQSLDAHMKDKHPEMGSSCSYCGTGQPHPRLSRGENHTCGYKPFHCEVCNYSTTTKGNLTIHMQSDRHLTKVQALQNGGMEVPDGCSTHSSPVSGISTRIPSPTKSKQRSSWRCEVCDYETSVAHNLRIHMTSEKHVHNIMLLQQTLKHMRGRLQPGLVPAEAQLYQYYLAQNMSLPGLKLESPGDLAHMMVSPLQFSPFASPGVIPGVVNDDLGKDVRLTNSQTKGDDRPLLSAGELSPLVGDQPQKLFQCSLCNKFASDNLEVLGLHVSEERVLPLEDWRTIAGDHFQCRLCGYSTQLRANFLLHCQTDRHLQRYQLAAHLKEAGEPNYWRLKDVAISNPVHLKCNVCDYRTNSVEKLRQHTANQRHEGAVRLYQHLQKQESMLSSESCYFYCALCDYSTKTKLNLVQHLLSAKHQQALGSQKLEFLHRGLGSEADTLGDLFYVKDRPKKDSEGLDGKIKAPAKTATNDQTKKDIDVHRKTKPGIATLSKEPPGTPVLGKRTLLPENGNDTTPKRPKSAEEAASNEQENQCSQCSYSTPDPNRMAMHMLSQHSMRSALCCPLCDDILSSRIHLQLHLTHLHSVAADCVEKLIAGGGPGVHRSKAQNKSIAGLQNILELKPQKASIDAPSWKRNQDQKNQAWQWKDQSGLQNQQLFTSNHDSYKQGSDQCSTEMQELRAHSQHRTTAICVLCLCSFQTVPEFRKHLESVHPELSASDVERLCRTLPVSQMNTENGERMFESKPQKDLVRERKDSPARSDSGSPLDELNIEQKHSFPLKKGSNFFVEKFLDPARPYKCTVCKESFTQKNILLVHYNSVSHLHKLKKVMHETTSPVLPEGSSKFDNKPFKCSICNVAYSQSSTLEIHMRSVLHQTKSRTSKVETGSSISNGNHGTTLPQRPVTINQEAIDSASLPVSTPKDNQTKAKESNRKQTAENSSAVLTQQLSLTPAQLQLQRDLTQQAAFFQSPFLSPAFWPPFPMPPSVLLHFQQPQFLFPFYVPGAEIKLNPDLASQAPILGLPGMTQTLLEDLRLQQSQLQQLQEEATKKLACDSEVTLQKQEVQSCEPQLEKKDTTTSEVHTTACEVEVPEDAAEESKKPDCEEESTKLNHISIATDDNGDVKKQVPEPLSLPPRVILGARGNAARALLENFGFELVIQYIENRQRNQRKNECADKEAIADKLECGTCGKLFSNILILKNHQEHVHRQIFPNGDLEKFAQQYREAYDKQYPMNPLSSATPPSTPPLPPPPLSPKPLPEPVPTVGRSQTPTEQKAPESPTPTQATPPPPDMSPQIPVPTSLELPPLLSVMTQQAGLSPYLSHQLPSSDSAPHSDIIQPCSQSKPDPASLEHVETKRPRARITKEQLKILCDSFKMNSYPGDEKVQELAEKSGLCQKFVKHWFRNTLLKERQRLLNSLAHSSSPSAYSAALKRKLDDREENGSSDKDSGSTFEDSQRDKRPRTTISPEQLEILYEKYLLDSNPTRKMLEHIANTVGLKKRVVQVWFQNTRARERKECTLCGTKFTTTFPIREHIFSKLHVEKLQERLRGHVDREKDHLTATTVRQLMAQQEFERFKKRTVDSLGTVAQQQSMTDGSALLGLSWPSSYPGIPGLPSGVNGHLKLPSFPPNTPGPPGDAFPSPGTPTTPISLSCTPTKTPHTPPPVPSSPLANHQVKLQDMDKPKTSVEPKLPLKEREISGCHLSLKKTKDREHEKRTPTKRTKSQGLLSTVAGDPGAFMAGQFLPYFVPGFVPCLPPQLPGFAQGGSIPPLCGLENLFPYGPGLPQAIAGLSSASLVQQQCKQYQQSVPDSLQQEKPQERKQQPPVPVEPSTTRSNTVQLKEEDAASFSAESTDQDLQSSAGNEDCPDAVMDPSMGEITCEKCRAVFTDQESALHHKESSCFGQSFTDLQVAVAGKAASRKYNSMAQNPTISMDKAVNQHVGMSPHKDEAARQAMRDAKEHIRLLPRSACSSTTPTSQSAISNRPPISCTSMASWPSVLFQTSSLSTASFLSPSAPLPSPLSTAPLVTSTTRGTSESRHSLPTEICLDKLGGHLSQKLDSIGKSLDLKTKAAPGLNTNFRNIRMDMFTV